MIILLRGLKHLLISVTYCIKIRAIGSPPYRSVAFCIMLNNISLVEAYFWARMLPAEPFGFQVSECRIYPYEILIQVHIDI